MISSKTLILTVITAIFFLKGCAPEDGGKKFNSVNLYLKNNSDFIIEKVYVSSSVSRNWGTNINKVLIPEKSEMPIGTIDCGQKFDFKSEFFSFIQPPAQALEKEVSCDFSSLTWVVENKTNYFE